MRRALVAGLALTAAALPAAAQSPTTGLAPGVADCPIVTPKPRPSGARLVEGPVWKLKRGKLFDSESLALAPGALVDPASGEVHFLFRFDSSSLEAAGWERATAEIAGQAFELAAMGPATKTVRGDRAEESLMVAVPAAFVERARGGAPIDGWLHGTRSREFSLGGEQAACLGRLLDAARASLGAAPAAAIAPAPAASAEPAAVAPTARPSSPMNEPVAPAPAVAPVPTPASVPAPAVAHAAAPPVIPGEPLPAYLRELWELAKLRDAGVLTQQEFERKKKQVLERSEPTAARSPAAEAPPPPPG